MSRRMLYTASLACALSALAIGGSIASTPVLYLIYIFVSLVLGGVGGTTLAWMLHAWWSPDSFTRSRLGGDDLEPCHSFSLIVPARHEEAVLESTLSRLVSSHHPAFQIIVVVGDDDPGTHAAAQRLADRHAELIRVVVDSSDPKTKPKALNTALPYCTGTITGVFDAEDDVHPALLDRVDQCFQKTSADVVQAGVQLMNFRSSWLTVRNVLEYYFWFRSRLHLHARQRFIPLGGNTVFVRTTVLRAVSGWDPECLAEDCELGVRLSALGAQTTVFYEPQLVTREECPPTLGSFVRQRTRWNQGYLQTLAKGYWRRLPRKQRILGAYILAMPYAMAMAWLMLPVSIATALLVKAPVPITLMSFLPALPMASVLVVEVAGLGEFCRAYGERASPRDYLRLVLGMPVYQAILAFAAARAVVRELSGARGWEKTAHMGLHLAPTPAAATSDVPRSQRMQHRKRAIAGVPRMSYSLPGASPSMNLLGPNGAFALARRPSVPASMRAEALNGDHAWLGDGARGPLWTRLSPSPAPAADPAINLNPSPVRGRSPAAVLRRLRDVSRVWVGAHTDLLVAGVLMAAVGLVVETNLLHWPIEQFDEGTYVANAWAVQHGRLAPYTYSYGHPPLAWLLIYLWTRLSGLLGNGSFSVDSGREFMAVVDIISCWLLYILARRLNFSRGAAAIAVAAFALSPLALYYHRAVLLDNPSIAWALLAFVLALSPQRRLGVFAASGACFAASVLSKETTLVLLPALVYAAAQNVDRRTSRYCLTLFVSFFVVIALVYPLYAVLKGELIPGRGHVSLIGYTVVQLLTRQGTGSVLDPHSQSHAIVVAWLKLDPWLLVAGLALTPVALIRRELRPSAVALLVQCLAVLRPGYLPNMYVIGLLPFAALIVAGAGDTVWKRWRRIGDRDTAWLLTPYLAVPVLIAATAVSTTWIRGDQAALRSRPDAPIRAAESWLVRHVDHRSRLIVTDDFWIYLIQSGFNAGQVSGGFYSPTVISYWPLDFDPAVRRHFPHGWRDFDYVILNQDMRVTMSSTPTAAQAVAHSRVVASFGQGAQAIQVRAIYDRVPGTP